MVQQRCQVGIHTHIHTRDEDRAGVEVIHALHARGLPFTGADARCFDQPKPQQKAAATRVGVATAPALLIEWGDDVPQVLCRLRGTRGIPGLQAIRRATQLRFPLIIKHPRGYGSVGMDLAAKVADEAALTTRVHLALAAWGCALVEEFVAGREATVLVVQGDTCPVALMPVECVFAGAPDAGAFKDFDTKFGAGRLGWRAMDRDQDAALAAALRDASVKVQGYLVHVLHRPFHHTCTLSCAALHWLCARRLSHRRRGAPRLSGAQPQLRRILPAGTGRRLCRRSAAVRIGPPWSASRVQPGWCIQTPAGFTRAIVAAAHARTAGAGSVQTWHDAARQRPGLRTRTAVSMGDAVLTLHRQPRWVVTEVDILY